MSRNLVEEATDAILDRIAGGQYRAGDSLPGEVELAAELNVSRLTLREAVKVLRERGVLRVVQGRGTFVVARSEWTDLGTLINMTLRTSSEREVGLKLVELRRMIEVGAAGLAARNRSEDDLQAIAQQVEIMDAAGAEADVETVVSADLAFHRAIMEASGNPFVLAVMAPLEVAMRQSRRVTSSDAAVRERAQTHHREVLRAIEMGDEQAAKDAMRSHMTQTRLDLLATTRPTEEETSE
ncbi:MULTISPECIES: FadR/GntR family transcriptional regulator [unclassified Actinobaculum]|uniref:FadR/GntR family transcriptional regulator n=1 Tax=unclassified Actinobaculum TaxID=2609299 RepID=UPI000D529C24|nr:MULTISPECIES: FadR/GntR family transcriptional regulator [unclassified Actinobaculum]AWE43305.1 FadR family transcriptional regulator [Actinobaculum sp. 313]RTE49797.1 FadR family transcriptional regulator [Actinobaculum sp. 352]